MIKVNNISFSYGNKNIIRDISFNIKKGQMTCLLGANGSGKTTIIKCLNGILQIDKGSIVLDNFCIAKMKQKEIAKKISMVPQEHTSIFSYRSIDVITMGVTPYLSFGSQPGISVYNRAKLILKKLNIPQLADRSYNNLSGGERQLVLIGRALMQDTGYLLMDEPTSHLDFKNQHLLLRKLKKFSREGAGIIVALHDPNLALKYCERVIIIKEGKILAKGKIEEEMNSRIMSQAYNININVNQAEQKVEIVGKDNKELKEVI